MDRISAANFHRQLAAMLDAGIALPDAVETAGSVTRGRWPARTAAWAQGCRAGKPLAEVMLADPAGGNAGLDGALVAAGEASGDLPAMCRSLAEWHEAMARLLRQLVGRALYPALLIHLALLLPGVVLWLTGRAPAWAMAVGPLGLWAIIGGIALGMRLAGHRGWLARWCLKQPLRSVAWPVMANRVCRVLRAGVSAGMLHRRSLELAAAGCGNRVVAARLIEAGQAIDRGELPTLAGALRASGLPHPVVVSIETADQAGRLEAELQHQVIRLDHQVEERMVWAARTINAGIYTTGVVFAVIAIMRMALSYNAALEAAMG